MSRGGHALVTRVAAPALRRSRLVAARGGEREMVCMRYTKQSTYLPEYTWTNTRTDGSPAARPPCGRAKLAATPPACPGLFAANGAAPENGSGSQPAEPECTSRPDKAHGGPRLRCQPRRIGRRRPRDRLGSGPPPPSPGTAPGLSTASRPESARVRCWWSQLGRFRPGFVRVQPPDCPCPSGRRWPDGGCCDGRRCRGFGSVAARRWRISWGGFFNLSQALGLVQPAFWPAGARSCALDLLDGPIHQAD